ncbi:putative RNA-directed DNA polymerase [Tanacetum coccineum]
MFSIASWNIRGLNRTPKQSEVRQVVSENNLSVCAILESHVELLTLSSVCTKVFRSWDWTSNANLCTKGCRIILGWNKDIVDVIVVAQSNQVVHAKIMHKADNKTLFCPFIYAGNKPMERRILWADLDFHKNVVRGSPWVLMGDFNVALNIKDSYSGSSMMSSAMCDFKDYVKKIEVLDINSYGLHFTWNQKTKGSDGMLKKLDRIMGNLDFVDNFPGAYALFQPYRISDHSPAVLRIPSLSFTKPKPFKFYNFLAYKDKFLEVLTTHWSNQVVGHAMFRVTQNMKNLKKPLRKLLHDQGNLHDRVNRLRVELDVVQKAIDADPSNSLLREDEVAYIQAFNEAKLDEERFLRQKAKIEWLDVGDSNSAYFHKTVKSSQQRSRIDVITNGDNVVVTGNNVPDVFVAHYESFLGTHMACADLDTTGLFNKHVSEMSNSNMVRLVTNEEIKRAMFDIGDTKSPSPDGYTSAFFKKGWDVVEVVSENQSAFVPGRRISDNILLTQELMHNYHRDKGPPRCAFKVDIQKAYDTVDWHFLGYILKKFGFYHSMIKWIMACVTSPSYSININGNVHGFFKGKWGLRQGDPLSPYLFTLVMEVLTLILQRRVRLSDSFRYHKQCEDLNIINVCFADDLFLFARGDVDSAKVIMESLDEFKEVSGLIPSIPKSTAYFCNVLNHVKISILNFMPFAEGDLPVQYLGVPLISSRLLNRDCKILIEKARNRIGDWKNKSLSFAGRLQLCKSVILSMQVYWASVLVIPMGIINDIQQLVRGFLWCNGEYKRGKAKVAWDDICLPKREGGLGLRSLEVFNLALMTTHIWNIVSNKESLWVRWIHTYKLRGRTFWDISPKNDMSWGWRKFLQLREIVKPFFWAQIGNGLKTSLWYDRWCLQGPLIRFLSPREIVREGYHLQSCVADLISNRMWNWPSAWLVKAPTLQSIRVPTLYDREDFVCWRDTNGSLFSFSVKCAWEALRPRGHEVTWYSTVWFSQCIPRNAFQLWLIMRDVMHIEKNVLESILNTLLMNDKSKDTAKARQDLKSLGIQSGLWLGQNKNEKCSKPQAAYSFTPADRKKFCQFIKGVKLPDGFGSNFKHKEYLEGCFGGNFWREYEIVENHREEEDQEGNNSPEIETLTYHVLATYG